MIFKSPAEKSIIQKLVHIKPCIASMHCMVNKICFQSMLSDATQCDVRIGSDSIFVSAVLHFINQFSEFYHNAMDTMWDFTALCEPSFIITQTYNVH